jgi:hypothetical protein
MTMDTIAYYEKYPFWIVLLSNVVSIAIYVLGAIIIYEIGLLRLILYILYILWLEIRILRKSCVNCYYHGKACAFGKGKICRLFFKKGDSQQFSKMKITWLDILPDFLVSIIPILAGVVLLIIDFNWLILAVLLLLVFLTSMGNGFIRGSLACSYCKQREIGCPTTQLFSRKKTEGILSPRNTN